MLSQFCIRRPIFATVLSLIIILAGLVAMRVLPLSQYPNITPPSVRVSATYDGADSETIARTVAQPIEDQLSGIEGLLYYTTSIRSNGVMAIICVFEVGTDPNDAMLEINNRVRTAERRLPSTVRDQGVTVRKRSEDELMMVALYSPDQSMPATEMADYATLNIVDELKRIPGIGDVNVFGNVESAMRIWLDPERMTKLGVTVSDVENAIESQNKQRAVGAVGTSPALDTQQLYYRMKTKGQLLTPEEFGSIIVKDDSATGLIRLRDIARTEVGKRSYEFRVDMNGQPGVNIGVYLQTGANSMAAATAVKARLEELRAEFPQGKMDYIITNDTTVFVGASLNEVYHTLGEAGLLVLIVVFVFLQSWRATIIPMLAVPVSLIGTMAGLWLFGFSLNTLTLFAMTLSIGIVVDDAIVVLENIERLMRTEHLSPFNAAIKAMNEVSGALVAIVLVLSAVFIPVAFLGGIAGELYRQFAVTVATSVAISGFVALTLTPALCAIILKPHEKEPAAPFRWFNKGLASFTVLFLQVVKFALRHRLLSATLLALTCVGCWQMLRITPTSFIPREDQGIVRMAMQLTEGTAFPRTEEAGAEMLKRIKALPGMNNVVTMMGYDTLTGDVRANSATYIMQLAHWDERTMSAQDYQQTLLKWLRESPDLRGTAVLPAPIPGLGSSNGFSGYITAHGSDNPLVLQEVTDAFLEELGKRPEITGLRSSHNADSPQLQVIVDRDRAYALGVDVADIYDTISAMMGSNYVNDFTRNGKTYRVVMQADAQFRALPSDIGRASVRSSSGEMIPLSTLVTTERVSGAQSLGRMNGYLGAAIMGAAAQGVSSGEAIAIVEETAREFLPPGYQVEWTGQAFHEKRIGASSTTAFAFGILVMFLILAALYERWSLPVAVVLAVPYAFLGAIVAVYLRGTGNDIYFQIGLLVLIGLTAKNAILIVEFAAMKMEEGMGPFEAAIEAAGLRFRPILMTSLAFVLGVSPMLAATGAGAAARHSMGTGVFGGMLAATFISTIFVPVFFTWFARRRKRRDEEETPKPVEAEPAAKA
ncbi:efflux RND transporter permease subunit [Sutterella sp.]|uniref:efflux RND transporter permease subunit n=1 Tax=Sutterella sp. TaxID=1981025 RepID=UPI0026E0541A|nr:multidrug efflux RND transporter permease subunit [Sutterella sp.]MDO5530645.1 multidrug efflux RND transporter permease subunit [Sutterella sp.]